jgi:hypothetical protein
MSYPAAEQLPPVPVLVTPRVHEQAAGEGITMLPVDPAELHHAYDDTRRTDLQGGSAITIGASKRVGGDKPAEAVLDGMYIGGGPRGKGEPGSKGAVSDDHTIHLQIETGKPITEADIAQRLAETLSVPARMRNTVRRGLGALALAGGTLAEVVSYAKYAADNDPASGSWRTWMVGGAVALVVGGGAIVDSVFKGRRINNGEARAAQRTPIRIHRK